MCCIRRLAAFQYDTRIGDGDLFRISVKGIACAGAICGCAHDYASISYGLLPVLTASHATAEWQRLLAVIGWPANQLVSFLKRNQEISRSRQEALPSYAVKVCVTRCVNRGRLCQPRMLSSYVCCLMLHRYAMYASTCKINGYTPVFESVVNLFQTP